MKTLPTSGPSILASLAVMALFFAGCASGPKHAASHVGMDPAAMEILKASSTKLGAARTLQVTAGHKLGAGLGLGTQSDRGPLKLSVQRPNQFFAVQKAGLESREIAYDGRVLCVMYPEAKHYAKETLEAATIEQFAAQVDARFGFRPPVSELFASDMATELLIDVTSIQVVGTEWVGWTRCEHLRLEQEGMTTDLWLGAKDHLPHRMLTTVTDMPGNPTRDVRFSGWRLNEPVDAGLFGKRPDADSIQVTMVRDQ